MELEDGTMHKQPVRKWITGLLTAAAVFAAASSSGPCLAQADEGPDGEFKEKKSEYLPPNPDKDPFRPLIVRERAKRAVDRTSAAPVKKADAAPVKTVVQEIDMNVMMIVGNEERRMAMVEFQGQLKELRKDDNVPGFFKVVEVKDDEVVVYSHKTKRRRAFKIKQ